MGSEFTSGLIGAIIGGLFTLWGTVIDGRRQERNYENDSKEKRRNVLIGVKTEIITILEVYQSRIAKHLDEYDGSGPFNLIFPITQNNFSFYESNAFYLTTVKEETLRSVVAFYSSARSLVDSFKYNNQIIENIIKKNALYNETKLDAHLSDLEDTLAIATDYGNGLKFIHNEAMEKVEVCLSSINVELVELNSLEKTTLFGRIFKVLSFRK
ncbi:hypothetical protein [Biostraticola tofi]|uniref:Uncharacterized protein n=1 Tax=Biostraticola tofi TaxID=466109 RepID=A0A4V2W3F1_9GAMM|nr:hypothetical protein [Biostraticola tofi]TCV91719.1 hypothetical protein EDC52_11541 [Biostraticola tofi]